MVEEDHYILATVRQNQQSTRHSATSVVSGRGEQHPDSGGGGGGDGGGGSGEGDGLDSRL